MYVGGQHGNPIAPRTELPIVDGDGARVTASAAELNALDGITATADELNALDVSVIAAGARTATAAPGGTTGVITQAGLFGFYTVTTDNADKVITLPAPVIGKQVFLINGATGYELRSSAPATIAINGGTGADAESAIAANSLVWCICISATAWKAIFLDADSDVAKVEAAA